MRVPPTGDGIAGVRLALLGRFDAPLYVAQPAGERHNLFVVEQAGKIRIVHDGHIEARPFLDLTNQVSSGGERGLLSMAFAPDYRRSGRFYVDFTDTAGNTRVQEFRRSATSPLRADPGSARQLLFVQQPFPNHNGGQLQFGPDGALYIGLGDGGSAGDPQRNGQNLKTLLAKILRIDPRPSGARPYAIPPDNPLAHESGARPEIYAYGLRNPWRFSFDRRGGALAIGDVGQDTYEEIDYVARGKGSGANFGWSAFEGYSRFNEDQAAPGAIRPVLVYRHGPACSVTGGYVVRDPGLRSLYGRYIYGDYCTGELRSFIPSPGKARGDRPLGPTIPSLSSFAQDSQGHIYATSLDGPVYRLDPSR